jgi:catechol 2,3-dioxygenase-like lactoylglutathione lyase family enzyme
MTLNHVHLQVRDLDVTVKWLREVCGVEPSVSNERMAIATFGAFTVIFDRGEADSKATLGFESIDCDADYQDAIGRGAVPIEAPTDRSWGTRSAYLRGPGAITIEIEQLSS